MQTQQLTFRSIVLVACLAVSFVQSLPTPDVETATLGRDDLGSRGIVNFQIPTFISRSYQSLRREVTSAASDPSQIREDLAVRTDNEVLTKKTQERKPKRSLAEIFSYAENALVNGPNIELGVVGIIVDTKNTQNIGGFTPP